MTGGGGVELRPDYRNAGGERHFMKFQVSDDRHEVRVVTDRGELQDIDADLMGGFLFAEQKTARFPFTVRSSRDNLALDVPDGGDVPVPVHFVDLALGRR